MDQPLDDLHRRFTLNAVTHLDLVHTFAGRFVVRGRGGIVLTCRSCRAGDSIAFLKHRPLHIPWPADADHDPTHATVPIGPDERPHAGRAARNLASDGWPAAVDETGDRLGIALSPRWDCTAIGSGAYHPEREKGGMGVSRYFNLVLQAADHDAVGGPANRWFNRGLAWAYGFNHEESVRCFEAAIEYDPGDCPMASGHH